MNAQLSTEHGAQVFCGFIMIHDLLYETDGPVLEPEGEMMSVESKICELGLNTLFRMILFCLVAWYARMIFGIISYTIHTYMALHLFIARAVNHTSLLVDETSTPPFPQKLKISFDSATSNRYIAGKFCNRYTEYRVLKDTFEKTESAISNTWCTCC